MFLEGVLNTPIGLLDRVRSRALRATMPWVRPAYLRLDRRVALYGAIMCALALSLVSLVPAWVIALGPVFLGIPHILADVRYLVLRPGLHRRWVLLGSLALSVGLASAGLGVRGALLGALAAAICSRGSHVRRGLALGAGGVALLLAARNPYLADFVFLHAHNGVALLFFVAWRPRRSGWFLVPIACALGGAALIASGALDGAFFRVTPPRGFDVDTLSLQLSPSADGTWAMRFALLYAFGQSVHYVVWLRLVPEESRGSGPRSYRQSLRALGRDVGSVVLIVALGSAVALFVYAAYDLALARTRYLQAAFFHGYLELPALAILFVEGALGPRVKAPQPT
jgi:hypothetical protein